MGVLIRLINLYLGKEATTKVGGIINDSLSYANDTTQIPTRTEDLIQSARREFLQMGLLQNAQIYDKNAFKVDGEIILHQKRKSVLQPNRG